MAVLDSNRASQKEVTAGRNVSGRDTYDYSRHIHQQPVVYREDRRLRSLIEEHEQAILSDPEYKAFSDRLNNYLNRKGAEGSLRDLQKKLKDGNREHMVEYAMELKENITKKVMKDCHFTSAQKIYTHLLTQMRTAFQQTIVARIKSGHFTVYDIDDEVLNKIITPLLDNIAECSLMIDTEELYGLLYILTGNCYIAWD